MRRSGLARRRVLGAQQSLGVGRRPDPLAHQVVERRLGGGRPSGGVPLGHHLVALGGTQQGQGADRALRLRGHRRQQPPVPLRQALRRAPVEQVGGVLQGPGEAAPVLALVLPQIQRQVDPGRAVVVAQQDRPQRDHARGPPPRRRAAANGRSSGTRTAPGTAGCGTGCAPAPAPPPGARRGAQRGRRRRGRSPAPSPGSRGRASPGPPGPGAPGC